MDSLEKKLKKYGLTKNQYEKMIKFSNNTCYICGSPPRTRALHIDHSHKTGKVRGLLCHSCNRFLIGKLGDKKNAIELYEKAAEYLKKYNS